MCTIGAWHVAFCVATERNKSQLANFFFRGLYKTLRPSVCLPAVSTWYSAPTGRAFVNLYVGDFYKNLLNKIAFGEDSTTIAFALREDLRACMLIFRHLQDKYKTCCTAREAKERVKDMYRILLSRRCDLHANNEEESPNAPLICCVFIILTVTIRPREHLRWCVRNVT